MLVRSIEPLTSLSPEQLALLDQFEWSPPERLAPELLARLDEFGEWPLAGIARDALRAYRFEDGHVTVAPFDARIRPGMDVVAEGSAGGVDTVIAPDGSGATLRWAAALREDR
jgi:hypothetical protein